MKANPEKSKRERQDWLIVLLILLLGFACVLVAGQYALRFAPSWKLDADMGSNLDLNSEFLTSKPVAYFEPLNPDILTQPSWVNGNIFLTPGASIVLANRTPLPTSDTSVTSVPTALTTATPVMTSITSTAVVTVSPTNTLVWIPIPATKTSKAPNTSVPPANTATNTSPPPTPSADLRITMSDGSRTTYLPGDSWTYTILVENLGPDNITGATVTDIFPAGITINSGSCATTGGATCGWGGVGNINDTVNLPAGSSILYTVNITVTGASGNLENRARVTAPGSVTDPTPSNNESIDINTAGSLVADLGVTIIDDDGVDIYPSGATLTYTVTVTNHGPNAVTGATVVETLTGPVTTSSWICTGAACPAGSGSGVVNHTLGNLPSGATVEYDVTVVTGASLLSNLSVRFDVGVPTGYTNPGTWPDMATDTDTPELNVGHDCISTSDFSCTYALPENQSIQLYLTGLATNGNNTPDLVYYERPSLPAWVRMDWVVIRVSPDGSSWTTVLYWGDYNPDMNTNISSYGPEDDDLLIPRSGLYPSGGTGIAIDLDSLGLSGAYPYIEIYAPPGGVDPQIYIDGIGLP